MDIEQLYWQFDAAHHGTGEYTGMARSERDAFKLVVACALAEKNREIAELKKWVQRPPKEWESVCGECNGSGWR